MPLPLWVSLIMCRTSPPIPPHVWTLPASYSINPPQISQSSILPLVPRRHHLRTRIFTFSDDLPGSPQSPNATLTSLNCKAVLVIHVATSSSRPLIEPRNHHLKRLLAFSLL